MKRKNKIYPLIQLAKRRKPFDLLSSSDWDNDLTPAIFDCKPYDRKKQGDSGTIFLKPGESSYASGLAEKTGAGISIPESGVTYTSGGGFVSRGSVSQSPEDVVRQTAQAKATAEAKKVADAKAKKFAEESARYDARIKAENIARGRVSGQLDISRSGAVTTGGVRYVGGAVPPGTGGLSATDYSRSVGDEAVSSGQVSQKDLPSTTFTVTPQQSLQEPVSQDVAISGLFGGDIYTGIVPTGTRTDLQPKLDSTLPTLFLAPTLFEKQVGTFEKNGKSIPETQIVFGEWKPISEGAKAKTFIETPATSEQRKFFKEETSILQASEDKPSSLLKVTGGKVGSVKDVYDISQQRVREVFTEPTIGRLFKEIDYEHGKSDLSVTTDFFIEKGVPKPIAKTGEFLAGAGLGILEDVRTKPLKSALIYGASFGAGAVVGGVSAGLGAIPKVGGILGTTFKVGTVGAGVYLGGTYAFKTVGRIAATETLAGKGSVLGVATKDIVIGGLGFAKGQATSTQLRGWWATRGRQELILEQGVYPSAPTSKHLKMFQKNVIKELGTEPGAFHTTSQKFWKKGLIEPKAGTSELPGLYGSTKLSTEFAKISGSSSSYKLLPSTKDLFSLSGKPGVAYLKPKGFRYSLASRVSPYKIGEQTFRYTFIKQPKPGYADVPVIKSEIEAIFRPGAGNYLLESGKYFVKIKGVRVPIDVFGYGGEVSVIPGGFSTPSVFGRGATSSYTLPTSYPILSPTSLGVTSYLSKVSSVKSYSSISSQVSKSKKYSRVSRLSSLRKSLRPSASSPASSLSRSYAPSRISKPYSPYYSYKPLSSKTPPFTIGKPRLKFKEKVKKKKKPFVPISQYQPSFTALSLNIRQVVPKDYEKYGYGALRLRAIKI